MWKRLLVVILIIAVAVTVDLLYGAAIQTAGENFDLLSPISLFRIRPIILIAGYISILIVGYSLVVTNQSGHSLSALLIAIGLAVSYLTAFPPERGFLPTRGLYDSLAILAASRLGLTLHAGAFLVAAGAIRLLPLAHLQGKQPSP